MKRYHCNYNIKQLRTSAVQKKEYWLCEILNITQLVQQVHDMTKLCNAIARKEMT